MSRDQVDRACAAEAASQLTPPERTQLAMLLIQAIQGDFAPARDAVHRQISWTRGWLVNVLGALQADHRDAKTVVEQHIDPAHEPQKWVRHWGLDGLHKGNPPDLVDIAHTILDHPQEVPLVTCLARAILAEAGDAGALKTLQAGVENIEWETLRALRVVYLPELADPLLNLINAQHGEHEYFNVYDAVMALVGMPPDDAHARRAANALANCIEDWHRFLAWDAIRVRTLSVLGHLKCEDAVPVLLRELLADNPSVVREAARALASTLDVETATIRIVETAEKPDKEGAASAYAAALRYLDRTRVVDCLEDLMVTGTQRQRDIANRLLYEVGGTAAFDKLRARTDARDRYLNVLEKAEERVRDQFQSSLRGARSGFSIATGMDVAIFILGFMLLIGSGFWVLGSPAGFANWVGIGITGGAGVLGVLHGTLIARPRRRVREAVDHLMRIQIVFLGYLRQLHQVDQAFTHRLLDETDLPPEEVAGYSNMVMHTMQSAVHNMGPLDAARRDAAGSQAASVPRPVSPPRTRPESEVVPGESRPVAPPPRRRPDVAVTSTHAEQGTSERARV